MLNLVAAGIQLYYCLNTIYNPHTYGDEPMDFSVCSFYSALLTIYP